jgi:hypothetical protein
MTLHVETHPVRYKNGKIKHKEALLLVTDTGVVVATFVSAEAVKLYIAQVALTWVFAHQAGRTGI